MRWTQMMLPTLKEVPAEAEAISHILMIRAGLIRKLTSGIYSYLPLGLKVLKKIEQFIREEMDGAGAQEVLLPAIQPAELWEKSGRIQTLGEDIIKFYDRHKKLNILGPTHEEVITSLVKNEVNSYRQLPLILYQIQTKFRDEARPRFGVVRAREFIMKDAYSFDRGITELNKSYQKMYEAYKNIFTRCGLKFVIVEADTGVMGGDISHEFMIIAKDGEDKIVRCLTCDYAASLDKAEYVVGEKNMNKGRQEKLKTLTAVKTPNISSVKEVSNFLKVEPDRLIKTLIYVSEDVPVAVLVRGDHDVNQAKLTQILKTKQLFLADEKIIEEVTKGPLGFSGPVGLKRIEIIADYAIKEKKNCVTGANKPDTHLINVNLDRDFNVTRWADTRNITEKDVCPRCHKAIEIKNAIEIGHVFKLGTKYTESLNATFLDEQGRSCKIIMGCYGIGVTRVMAACIEQNQDENGIVWPQELTPFRILVIPLNVEHKLSRDTAEELYWNLVKNNVEVIIDDRSVRAGIKFKDADLIGIPIQVIIGEKNIEEGLTEIRLRHNKKRLIVKKEQVVENVLNLCKNNSGRLSFNPRRNF